jgi:hypothetical protein
VWPIIEGVHIVPMGTAIAFLTGGDDGFRLIDAGYPGHEAKDYWNRWYQ